MTIKGRWALLPLRLLVGFGFAAHGYAKLARGPESFAAILQALAIPAPGATAWATALLEFLGGISLMLGAYVVPLSLPLAAVMVAAMFLVHLRYGFSSIRLLAMSASGAVFGPVGYELNLLYIAALATLGLSGSSPLSVDRWREARQTSPETPREAEQDEPLPTEDAFFNALVEGSPESLQAILADDFVIVDVMRGAEIGRSSFLAAIAARQLRLTTLSVVERRVRRYGEVAVVVGRTAMRGDLGGEPFTAASRYTHVFARAETGAWRLVAAQGTQIVE